MGNRQTKLLVNVDAMVYNYNEIKKYQKDKIILPVLKAGGYGIGLEAIGRFIDKTKIDIIGTAIVDEGIELREKLNYQKEIVVINQPAIEEIDNILKYNITTGVCYIDFLEKLDEAAANLNKISKVHIEIETGMGRTGVQEENLEEFIYKINKLKNIQVEGIYTHFASSDTDIEYTKEQIKIFERVVKYIKVKIPTIKYIHCGNSAAIIQFKDVPGNMIRPGIMLYGYLPDETLKNKIALKPSCVLKSRISFMKQVEKGISISYGRTFITSRKSKIANVPIGYADGIKRALSNKGYVIINNKKAPIVGKVCMDRFMIDVTEIDDVKIGDEVYIWDNNQITIEDIAKLCDTINYDILSTISNRVVRELV